LVALSCSFYELSLVRIKTQSMRLLIFSLLLFNSIDAIAHDENLDKSSEKKISVMTWNVKLLHPMATFK
jgi:hypothetical protein